MSVIPLWVKLLGVGLVCGGLLYLGFDYASAKRDAKEAGDRINALETRLSKTEQQAARLDQIYLRRDELQGDIRNNVADVTVRIKQEAANDPATANFLVAPLPNGMRKAILEANAARTAAQHTGTSGPNANRRKVQK